MHTPFFICTVTISAIIHLAAYSVIVYADGGASIRERVQMATGALKVLSGVWPIAGAILQQVKEIARGIFFLGPQGNSGRATGKDHATATEVDGGVAFINNDLWLDEMIESFSQ